MADENRLKQLQNVNLLKLKKGIFRSEEQIAELKSLFLELDYFKNLPNSLLQKCLQRADHKFIRKNQVLLPINSISKEFLVVLQGSIGVCTVMNKNDDEVDIQRNPQDFSLVHVLRKGASIGTVDLICPFPRSSTVVALQDTHFIRLVEEEFKSILWDYEKQKIDIEVQFLKQAKQFKNFSFQALKSIYSSLFQLEYQQEIVYSIGDSSNSVFIIKAGNFYQEIQYIHQGIYHNSQEFQKYPVNNYSINDSAIVQQVKHTKRVVLDVGQIFGDDDVLSNQVRSVSVYNQDFHGILFMMRKNDYIRKVQYNKESQINFILKVSNMKEKSIINDEVKTYFDNLRNGRQQKRLLISEMNKIAKNRRTQELKEKSQPKKQLIDQKSNQNDAAIPTYPVLFGDQVSDLKQLYLQQFLVKTNGNIGHSILDEKELLSEKKIKTENIQNLQNLQGFFDVPVDRNSVKKLFNCKRCQDKFCLHDNLTCLSDQKYICTIPFGKLQSKDPSKRNYRRQVVQTLSPTKIQPSSSTHLMTNPTLQSSHLLTNPLVNYSNILNNPTVHTSYGDEPVQSQISLRNQKIDCSKTIIQMPFSLMSRNDRVYSTKSFQQTNYKQGFKTQHQARYDTPDDKLKNNEKVPSSNENVKIVKKLNFLPSNKQIQSMTSYNPKSGLNFQSITADGHSRKPNLDNISFRNQENSLNLTNDTGTQYFKEEIEGNQQLQLKELNSEHFNSAVELLNFKKQLLLKTGSAQSMIQHNNEITPYQTLPNIFQLKRAISRKRNLFFNQDHLQQQPLILDQLNPNSNESQKDISVGSRGKINREEIEDNFERYNSIKATKEIKSKLTSLMENFEKNKQNSGRENQSPRPQTICALYQFKNSNLDVNDQQQERPFLDQLERVKNNLARGLKQLRSQTYNNNTNNNNQNERYEVPTSIFTILPMRKNEFEQQKIENKNKFQMDYCGIWTEGKFLQILKNQKTTIAEEK